MVVEDERTMTHQGDPSVASELPAAQDDSKQVCLFFQRYLAACTVHACTTCESLSLSK